MSERATSSARSAIGSLMARYAVLPRTRLETLAFVALILFLGYRIWPQIGAASGIASDNAPVPPFSVTSLDGQTLSAAQLRGDVVLVNFWATWCTPCRVEMPGFQRVYDERKGDGLVVLGISTDGDRDQIRQFLTEHHITYPIAIASGEVAPQFGGLNVLPTSFLIDRNGRIRNEVRGYFASVALEQAVNRLLAEPRPPAARVTTLRVLATR